MRFSTLGHTGVEVSRVSLGTAFFGVHIKEEECARILDRALELGINVIDTAEKYIRPKPGTSESVLGDLLQGRREEVFLATKVDPGRAWAGGSLNRGLTKRVLVQAVEGSLRRLDTDHIDLLYAHEPDSSTPLDETIAAFDHLIQAGKVRYAGLSNFPAWQLVEALWTGDRLGCRPISAAQDLYNVFERGPESDLYPVCQRDGVGTFAYSPLAGGLVTGKYTQEMAQGDTPVPKSIRAGYFERVTEESGEASSAPKLTRNALARAARIAAWSRDRGYTGAQAALAWVLGNPDVTSAILGVSTVQQLDSNASGFDLVLTPAERNELSELAAAETE